MVKASFAVRRKLDTSLPGLEASVADLAELDLPRFQTGFPPQHLLLTLFGEHLSARREPVASAALVKLLGEFDVNPAGARAALNRLAARGVLVASKAGRNTFYRPTDTLMELLPHGQALTLRFGKSMRGWSGQWTFVAFSLPEDARQQRPVLRTRLRLLGYAPLYDGLWVSPYPPDETLTAELAGFREARCTVLCGVADDAAGLVAPASAWDLGESRVLYDEFTASFRSIRKRMHAGRVGAAEALVAHTRALYRWFVIATLDPDLPAELLPADWPRNDAHDLFADVVDTLGPLAEQRVHQVLAEFGDSLQ